MAEHVYKGERIVRSDYQESKRWRIISIHPATGMRFWEESGDGYYTLADARAAIDEAIDASRADDARR